MREQSRDSDDRSGRDQDRDRDRDREDDSEDHSGRGRSGGDDSGSRRSRRELERRERSGLPRIELEHDRHGGERVRGEVVIVGTREQLSAIGNSGFAFIERTELRSLEAEIGRIRTPAGRSVEALIAELRRIAPGCDISPQHVYRASGSTTPVSSSGTAGAINAALPAPRIGLIDTGAGSPTSALRIALTARRGFTAEGYVPRDHGTAVAQVAALAGAQIASADVFGLDSSGEPAATALALALAVDWLISERVGVINISIEGPDNPILARMVRRALASDVAVVAAAGNQGPSAPPGFPAAYEGVVAVTAIDARSRPYRRAGRGAHIAFAAPGVDIKVPGADGRLRRVSGTSFAAPEVAVRIAQFRSSRPEVALAQLVDNLRFGARDLGAPGKDVIFGWGELRPLKYLNVLAR